MQKPKEMAERGFALLLGGFTCGTGWNLNFLLKFGWFPPPVRKALTSSTRAVNAASHSFSFWMQSIICFTCRNKGQGSTWAYKYHLYSKLKLPLLQYNSWHAPGWICSQVTALHCALQKVLIPPCLELHVVSIGHFLGWVFLWEEMKLIFLCLFWLSTKNGKKVRVLIYT